MVPYLRIYNKSIFNYIKYQVLPTYFTEEVRNEPLIYDSLTNSYIINSKMSPNPSSQGRGFSVFDEYTVGNRTYIDTSEEQSDMITVNGATTYTVDYANCRIINPDTTPTSVDYKWNVVSTIIGWPGDRPPELPVVAITTAESLKKGFQLGGGSQDILKCEIHVFATSENEKQDITDCLYQALYNRNIPILNWHEGDYLDNDGTYTGFVPTTVSGLTQGSFLGVKANLVRQRLDWSELNRYRSYITFDFSVYKDD